MRRLNAGRVSLVLPLPWLDELRFAEGRKNLSGKKERGRATGSSRVRVDTGQGPFVGGKGDMDEAQVRPGMTI